jgi:hypothetical protein
MGRLLNELSPRFRPLAVEFLARCVEAKIPVLITCTGRTSEEQAAAITGGFSRVVRSTHQDGDALDIAPFDQYLLHGPDKLQYDATDPVWKTVGQIAQDLGLRWGGTFTPLNRAGIGWDPGHVEYPLPLGVSQPDT